jgi:hypothetical protein
MLNIKSIFESNFCPRHNPSAFWTRCCLPINRTRRMRDLVISDDKIRIDRPIRTLASPCVIISTRNPLTFTISAMFGQESVAQNPINQVRLTFRALHLELSVINDRVIFFGTIAGLSDLRYTDISIFGG